ncbi:acyltransferase family protein [Modestobacter marinus]|uniref:acyltransferase family protein n=1 Tax=Modestobacter marinus TaxID=477641 RepID=UPI001C985641|nr:acyltransferase family protein [Modestobacter marinus]
MPRPACDDSRPSHATTQPREHDGHGREFRADIEGLRAIAVLAVVLFHAGVAGLAGGYVGVDVFLVVSGFLITGMLWRELQATGTVRLARFYGGRARRLLPAGAVVLVSTAVAAAWLLPPLSARVALGDAVAAAVYGANYRLALRGTDYLAADEPPSPFQHYWSLAVEEQFYLLWPALLVGTAWLTGRRSLVARRVVPAVGVLTLVTAGSFALSLWWTHSSPPWAYFSLPSRAWELGVGGLVALSVPAWRRLPPTVAATAGWTGLAVVLASCCLLDEGTPFPGTAALLPVLGTALLLGAGSRTTRRGPAVVLELSPLRRIGRWSYSWYLWHWPVLVLAPTVVGRELGLGDRLLAAAVALVLAVATLHAVEDPLRFAAPLRRSAGRSLLLGGSATAIAATAALVALAAVPAPVGSGAAVEAAHLSVPDVPTSTASPSPEVDPVPVLDPTEVVVQQLTAQVQAAVAASAGAQAVPSNLTPSLSAAKSDVPAVFSSGCVRTWLAAEPRTCEYGDPAGPVSLALVGDSHAAQWVPALQPLAEQRGWHLQFTGKVTCPLLDLAITSPYLGRAYTECVAWRQQVVEQLEAHPPTLVLLSMVRRYGADFGFTSYDQQWLDALTRLVSDLRATGSQVLVLGPIPDPHTVVPTCLSAHLDSVGACTPARATAVDDQGVAAEVVATEAAGGDYADVTDLFCTDASCPLVVGNRLVFRDDNHLTASYATFLGPVIGALIDRELATGSR